MGFVKGWVGNWTRKGSKKVEGQAGCRDTVGGVDSNGEYYILKDGERDAFESWRRRKNKAIAIPGDMYSWPDKGS